MQSPRWEHDDSPAGLPTPDGAANPLDRMAAEMRADGWLTESPERHLRPKLDRWLGRHAEWDLLASAVTEDGWWQIRARWRDGRDGSIRDLRAAAIGLVGSFAESTTFIRQTEVDGVVSFEVATGQPGDPAGFAAHGHLVRLMVERG